MNYQNQADQKIQITNLLENPIDRCSPKVRELLEQNYIIDVHSHLFDIRCINKWYFILRFVKDALGIKSYNKGLNSVYFSEEEIYQYINLYDDNWENDLLDEFDNQNLNQNFGLKNAGNKGIIDYWNARKFLSFKRMSSVYKHYINNFSLAENFKDVPKKNVLITALMMDLETGWNTRIRKTFYQQIKELKTLSKNYPVLPFLFCDPRRADITNNKRKNLYDLFNFAFCETQSFFGVKIYPALGYDPSDYRLWPIYKICEEYKIPVLTHCGGETISTASTTLLIYEGANPVTLNTNNRKEMAKELNDPIRWKLVLEKFPNLKLNFAHFGGYETWEEVTQLNESDDPQHRKETIINFIKNYPNVYADFSFNLVENHLSKNLKSILYYSEEVRNKTMFGTDYWVVNPEGDLRREQKEFLNIMYNGIPELDLPQKLCFDNPKRYLFE